MGLFDRSTARGEAGAPAVDAYGYDFVDVRTPEGSVQRMSRTEFEAQALAERIRILVEGAAVFIRGSAVVPPSVALKGNR
jgi:hypothetical protein